MCTIAWYWGTGTGSADHRSTVTQVSLARHSIWSMVGSSGTTDHLSVQCVAQVVSLSQHGECAATGTGAKCQAGTQGIMRESQLSILRKYTQRYTAMDFLIDLDF